MSSGPLEVTVRRGVVADAEDIIRLSSDYPVPPEERLPRVRGELASLEKLADRLLVIVAETPAHGVVGFAKTRLIEHGPDAPANSVPEGWHLAGVAVDHQLRRRGVGARLTRERLEFIRQRADVAYCFVARDNLPSMGLHAKLGFEEVAGEFHYPSFDTTGFVFMRAELAE